MDCGLRLVFYLCIHGREHPSLPGSKTIKNAAGVAVAGRIRARLAALFQLLLRA